jgi:hypothetical protein
MEILPKKMKKERKYWITSRRIFGEEGEGGCITFKTE